MLFNKEKLSANLLFIISFCITALAIYVFRLSAPGPLLVAHHTYTLNIIFINLTFLGSSLFSLGLVLYLFYKKRNMLGWLITAGTIITILFIQIIKNYLHNNGVHIFFEDELYHRSLAANQDPKFISSHTAIAFNLATICCLYLNNRIKSVAIFLMAIAVAYSRIYLSHHAIFDILVGGFTGLAAASIVFYYHVNRLTHPTPSTGIIKQKYSNYKLSLNPFSVE